MPFYSRKVVRLQNFDYSSINYYFITICTEDKKCIFGDVRQLNCFGKIAKKDIEELSSYKAGVSRKIRKINPDCKVWQRSFYEHVIRNREDYDNIWNYIENNPLKWELDRFYKQCGN